MSAKAAPTRGLVSKFLWLFLVCFGLAAGGGVLVAAGETAARQTRAPSGTSWYNEVRSWLPRAYEAGSALQHTGRQFLVVAVLRDEVKASFTMAVPRDGELYQRAMRYAIDGAVPSRDALRIVGTVVVSGTTLVFQPPEVTIRGDSAILRFDARRLKLDPERPEAVPLYLEVKFPGPDDRTYPEIFLRPGPHRVATIDGSPDELTREQVVWRGGTESRLFVVLHQPTTEPVHEASGTVFTKVLRAGRGFNAPIAGPLTDALALALPLVLLLLVAWAAPAHERQLPPPASSIAELLIVALMVIGAAGAIEDLGDLVVNKAPQGARTASWWMLGQYLAHGSAPAGYTLLAVFWPAMVALARQPGRPSAEAPAGYVNRPSAWAVTIAIAGVALSIGAVAVLFPWAYGVAPPARPVLMAAAGCVLLLAAVSVEFGLFRKPYVGITGLAMFALAVAAQVLETPPLSVFLLLILYIPFVLALVKLLTLAVRPNGYGTPPRRARVALTVAAAALGAMFVAWLRHYWDVEYARLLSPSFVTLDIRSAVPIILAALLLGTLYRASRPQLTPFGAQALAAGSLLGAVVFFSPLVRWYLIPVPFLTGWILLRLLVSVQRVDTTEGIDVPTARSLLDEMVDVKIFRRSFHAHRTQLLGKVAKGEMPFPEYEAQRQELEKVLEEKEAALRSQSRVRPEMILAGGAIGDPWENAVVNARWGGAFGIPWILLSLLGASEYSLPSTLDFLLQMVLVIGIWPMYGFFFGYFYPRIPGWSGFAKGWSFALSMAVPVTVVNAISLAGADEWRQLGVYALGVLIHSLLLGLANDLAMLRRYGFTWRALADLHNLTAVTAWFSTLVIAIATALATVLTSGATDVFKRALERPVPAASSQGGGAAGSSPGSSAPTDGG